MEWIPDRRFREWQLLWILDKRFGDDSGGHSRESGNPGSISSSNVREKNNIDSPLLISGITENENNKEKERKHWIPNQVGDDIGVVFGDDSGKDFGDDSYSPSSWESIFLNDWKILVFFSKLSIIS